MHYINTAVNILGKFFIYWRVVKFSKTLRGVAHKGGSDKFRIFWRGLGKKGWGRYFRVGLIPWRTLWWAVNAKNSLTLFMVIDHIAIAQNPILPCAATSKPPALTDTPTIKILEENLHFLHKARQAFIESENSEWIKRALNQNIWRYSNTCFLRGNSVYFKRAHKNWWQGPGKVLGQDGQQVPIKYVANHVRVHPCRITLDRNPIATTKQPSKGNTGTGNENRSSSSKMNQTDSNLDLDLDNFDSNHSNSLDNQIQSDNITNNMTHNNPQPIKATKTWGSTNSLQKKNTIQYKYNNGNN